MPPFENTSNDFPSPSSEVPPWIVGMSLVAWALSSGIRILVEPLVRALEIFGQQGPLTKPLGGGAGSASSPFPTGPWYGTRLVPSQPHIPDQPHKDATCADSVMGATVLSAAVTDKMLADLPYSSDKDRIYVLPEEDMVTLLKLSAPPPKGQGVDPDQVLLQLWSDATHYDLDVMAEADEDLSLAEVISAATEIDPEALHAIVFTYSPEED